MTKYSTQILTVKCCNIKLNLLLFCFKRLFSFLQDIIRWTRLEQSQVPHSFELFKRIISPVTRIRGYKAMPFRQAVVCTSTLYLRVEIVMFLNPGLFVEVVVKYRRKYGQCRSDTYMFIHVASLNVGEGVWSCNSCDRHFADFRYLS